MARILLGVSGGIAAYKAVEYTRLAQRAGHAVRVVATADSQRFVGPQTFAGITGAPVLVSDWEPDPLRGAWPGEPSPAHVPLSHLELAARADVLLIAPATANTIAKLAAGMADSLLCALALARPAALPTIVAPAMNNHMYEHPATQANVATLRERGITVLEPGVGPLGSPGEQGVGRLPEPPELLAACEAALAPPQSDLAGLRVLVTAGGTREPIDSVRYVGNRSSGRMGLALAAEAARRGAAVTLVAANVALPRPHGVTAIDVETAAELKAAADAHFPDCDILLMAAAVADFRPAARHDGKIVKTVQGEGLALELERTEDVLAGLGARRAAGQLLIGFAAEHGEGGVQRGRGKLERKRLDAVVVNDIARGDIGFEAGDNEVTIVTADGEVRVGRRPKQAVARAILDLALTLRSSSPTKV